MNNPNKEYPQYDGETASKIEVTVIGAGLAGCEAAWRLANNGISVKLYEMKPQKFSPAHKSENFAELVCSNSLKSDRIDTAGGLLKAEMRQFGSLLLEMAERTKVPAGGALAVNREDFSKFVTEKIETHPNIEVVRSEITKIPTGNVIIATGPLTSNALAEEIISICGGSEYLSFYDAAAPIIEADSINMDRAFFGTRYDKGDPDYINCPMTAQEYAVFYNELINGQSAELKSFEQKIKVYEGCMPVEILAKRGEDTLRFGPLKPVGLTDSRTNLRSHAVVQLRKEDTLGSQYNMVGFQTNLKFPEQKRIFSLIPGLENAEFSRYGVMHRNTFIDSPRLLNFDFTLKDNDSIMFAGQITGVEGYMESAASGILAAFHLIKRLGGGKPSRLPDDTMLGALSRYISNESTGEFQPMGANMGILPPAEIKAKKQERYKLISARAVASLKDYLATNNN